LNIPFGRRDMGVDVRPRVPVDLRQTAFDGGKTAARRQAPGNNNAFAAGVFAQNHVLEVGERRLGI